MSLRRDDGLPRRAAIALAAAAFAVGAWSEIDRTSSQAGVDDLARDLARVEAALLGREPSAFAGPIALTVRGVRFEVAVDDFGATTTARAVAEARR